MNYASFFSSDVTVVTGCAAGADTGCAAGSAGFSGLLLQPVSPLSACGGKLMAWMAPFGQASSHFRHNLRFSGRVRPGVR